MAGAIRLLTATAKYCVYYGGKKNGNVICLADTCVCSDEIRHAKQAYRRERSF